MAFGFISERVFYKNLKIIRVYRTNVDGNPTQD
jgi:hypothetical protein